MQKNITVIILDAKYRASIAAVRAAYEAGADVVLTQTSLDTGILPPSFQSKCVKRTVLFDCSVDDADKYLSELTKLIQEYDKPVLFPVGAKTTGLLSENREELSEIADFILPTKEALDFANDKNRVRELAGTLSIKVPYTYKQNEEVNNYPVVVKPECGEKYGLTAADRYIISNNNDEYKAALSKMSQYGENTIVQEKIEGAGIGVSLLMAESGRAVSALCHRRIREYPISGGPSSCLVSFYDEDLVRQAERLLSAIGYTGFAMVEFKGDGYLLEINPRVWGSFPMTYVAKSTFVSDYIELSKGASVEHKLDNYIIGKKMNFVLSDLAAVASYLLHGKIKIAFSGLCDIIFHRAVDGIYDKNDKKPYKAYLMGKFFRK